MRDLIFHIQEHRFKLPEISKILNELGLNLLGFTIGNDVKQNYLSTYADDIYATSLDNWNSYEIENPDTFCGMYQFFVQKNKYSLWL